MVLSDLLAKIIERRNADRRLLGDGDRREEDRRSDEPATADRRQQLISITFADRRGAVGNGGDRRKAARRAAFGRRSGEDRRGN
ncbi:hypothetical protein H7F51_14725 [Novosphingobium flavum]|uniref:Uncharacterized protein n=1 Tax=Novosphingobium flavum TaxID=1778672 RepID=A0A7X1FTQ4_9SPHN|nr:hypothetical protein [Novosphingobium flavum]MBC2666771.1 hypothetical protein [Novosphingobium flavum]